MGDSKLQKSSMRSMNGVRTSSSAATYDRGGVIGQTVYSERRGLLRTRTSALRSLPGGYFSPDVASPIHPNPLMIVPFVALLAAIALAPLFFAHWWGKHFAKVSF